jgi:hypothetical protein
MKSEMATCVTCGDELHPERAERYDYCTRPECRRRNARGLEIAAVGVNKAADQFVVLDERTKQEAASGRFKKRPDAAGSLPSMSSGDPVERKPTPVRKRPPARPQWSQAQENLALIYRRLGMKPHEIAAKLGVTERLVTKILLDATARGRR